MAGSTAITKSFTFLLENCTSDLYSKTLKKYPKDYILLFYFNMSAGTNEVV